MEEDKGQPAGRVFKPGIQADRTTDHLASQKHLRNAKLNEKRRRPPALIIPEIGTPEPGGVTLSVIRQELEQLQTVCRMWLANPADGTLQQQFLSLLSLLLGPSRSAIEHIEELFAGDGNELIGTEILARLTQLAHIDEAKSCMIHMTADGGDKLLKVMCNAGVTAAYFITASAPQTFNAPIPQLDCFYVLGGILREYPQSREYLLQKGICQVLTLHLKGALDRNFALTDRRGELINPPPHVAEEMYMHYLNLVLYCVESVLHGAPASVLEQIPEELAAGVMHVVNTTHDLSLDSLSTPGLRIAIKHALGFLVNYMSMFRDNVRTQFLHRYPHMLQIAVKSLSGSMTFRRLGCRLLLGCYLSALNLYIGTGELWLADAIFETAALEKLYEMLMDRKLDVYSREIIHDVVITACEFGLSHVERLCTLGFLKSIVKFFTLSAQMQWMTTGEPRWGTYISGGTAIAELLTRIPSERVADVCEFDRATYAMTMILEHVAMKANHLILDKMVSAFAILFQHGGPGCVNLMIENYGAESLNKIDARFGDCDVLQKIGYLRNHYIEPAEDDEGNHMDEDVELEL